jgi:hypothetical protein
VAHDSTDGPGGDCWRLNARPAHPRPVKVMAIIALAFTTAPLRRCTAASGARMPGVRRPMQACCGAQRRGGPVAFFNVGCVCAGCNRGGRDFKKSAVWATSNENRLRARLTPAAVQRCVWST